MAKRGLGYKVSAVESERWREKIRAASIINRLYGHVHGEIEMSPTQVRAAEVLLRKVMPDLSTAHIEGHVTHSLVDFLRAINDRSALDGLPSPTVVDVQAEPAEVRH